MLVGQPQGVYVLIQRLSLHARHRHVRSAGILSCPKRLSIRLACLAAATISVLLRPVPNCFCCVLVSDTRARGRAGLSNL